MPKQDLTVTGLKKSATKKFFVGWDKRPSAKNYEIVVTDDKGKEMGRVNTDQTEIDLKTLQSHPGKYEVSVVASDDKEDGDPAKAKLGVTKAGGIVKFTVLPPAPPTSKSAPAPVSKPAPAPKPAPPAGGTAAAAPAPSLAPASAPGGGTTVNVLTTAAQPAKPAAAKRKRAAANTPSPAQSPAPTPTSVPPPAPPAPPVPAPSPAPTPGPTPVPPPPAPTVPPAPAPDPAPVPPVVVTLKQLVVVLGALVLLIGLIWFLANMLCGNHVPRTTADSYGNNIPAGSFKAYAGSLPKPTEIIRIPTADGEIQASSTNFGQFNQWINIGGSNNTITGPLIVNYAGSNPPPATAVDQQRAPRHDRHKLTNDVVPPPASAPAATTAQPQTQPIVIYVTAPYQQQALPASVTQTTAVYNTASVPPPTPQFAVEPCGYYGGYSGGYYGGSGVNMSFGVPFAASCGWQNRGYRPLIGNRYRYR